MGILFMYAICVCGTVAILKNHFSFLLHIYCICVSYIVLVFKFLYARFLMKVACFLYHLTDSISCGSCELLWIMWNVNE
jgi:hypothetical protein